MLLVNVVVDQVLRCNMLIEKFNYKKIDRQTVNGKRHYCLPDGSKVPSVTTILDATKPEEAKAVLNNWRKRMGAERAQQITTEAASRGTRMHKWLELYVKNGRINEPGTNPYSKQSHTMANTIIAEGLSPNVSEVWGIEVPLFYSGLYAGTSDQIGIWKDRPTIFDFKQTNKPKKREWIEDYFLQLAAYAQAHNQMFGTNIKSGLIMMCSKDFQYQEFHVVDEEFDYYVNLWWDRVEQYYRNQL